MKRFLRDHAAQWPLRQRQPLNIDIDIAACIPSGDSSHRVKVARATPPVHTEAVPSAERSYSNLSTAEPFHESDTPAPEIVLPPAFQRAKEFLEREGAPIPEPHSLAPLSTHTIAQQSRTPMPRQRSRNKTKPAKSKCKRIAARSTIRPSPPRKQSRPQRTQVEIDISHHERRCTICHHPQREAMEEAFLQWRNVGLINHEFKPEGGRSAIYRHANALKLFKQRNLNLRSALEFIIEESERTTPTAEGIVRAIRAYTRINDAGEWIDSPTTHVVQVVAMPSAPRNYASPSPTSSVNAPHKGRPLQPLLTGTAPQTKSAVND